MPLTETDLKVLKVRLADVLKELDTHYEYKQRLATVKLMAKHGADAPTEKKPKKLWISPEKVVELDLLGGNNSLDAVRNYIATVKPIQLARTLIQKLIDAKNDDKVRQIYDLAIMLLDTNAEPWDSITAAHLWIAISACEALSSKVDKALLAATSAIELDPTNDRFYEYRSCLLIYTGGYGEMVRNMWTGYRKKAKKEKQIKMLKQLEKSLSK